jgi:hypothetical protein
MFGIIEDMRISGIVIVSLRYAVIVGPCDDIGSPATSAASWTLSASRLNSLSLVDFVEFPLLFSIGDLDPTQSQAIPLAVDDDRAPVFGEDRIQPFEDLLQALLV